MVILQLENMKLFVCSFYPAGEHGLQYDMLDNGKTLEIFRLSIATVAWSLVFILHIFFPTETGASATLSPKNAKRTLTESLDIFRLLKEQWV